MEEGQPSCARLRRGAGFSHCNRGASLLAPDRQGFSALYISELGCKKESLMPRTWGGVASGRHQHRPAEIHRPSEKRLGLPRGGPTRERLTYGVRPTHAIGRALADSQHQRRLSSATASSLVGSLERTIDVACAELGKPNAEMPSRRRI
jgi:hypothetical protein